MADLIERYKITANLPSVLMNYCNRFNSKQLESITEMIYELENSIESADVQPVRRGEWEDERYDDLLGCYIATCSECGYESTDRYRITDNHKHCEYCGASMEDLIPIETVLADMESDSGIVAEAAKDYLNIHRDEYRGDRRAEND